MSLESCWDGYDTMTHLALIHLPLTVIYYINHISVLIRMLLMSMVVMFWFCFSFSCLSMSSFFKCVQTRSEHDDECQWNPNDRQEQYDSLCQSVGASRPVSSSGAFLVISCSVTYWCKDSTMHSYKKTDFTSAFSFSWPQQLNEVSLFYLWVVHTFIWVIVSKFQLSCNLV